MSSQDSSGRPRATIHIAKPPLGIAVATPLGTTLEAPPGKHVETYILGWLTPSGKLFCNDLVDNLITHYIDHSNIDNPQSCKGVDTFTGKMGGDNTEIQWDIVFNRLGIESY